MKEYTVKVGKRATSWYNLKGKLHREDGPAIEYINGDKSWYLNGQLLFEKEFNEIMNKISDVEKAAEYYAHNYFDMHETNSYKELKKGFLAGVEWLRK